MSDPCSCGTDPTASLPGPRGRTRLLQLNRAVSWVWFAAMCIVTLASTRQHGLFSQIVLSATFLVRLYLFCHAGIALWAYRLPRPRLTRFHLVLYSGYSVLFLTLLSFATSASWQGLVQEATWAVIAFHLAVVSWSACTRYRLPVLLKYAISLAAVSLDGIMAFVALHADHS